MSSPEEETTTVASSTESTTGVTRKSLLQASAWTAPVVAAAIAAPSAAASGPSTTPTPVAPTASLVITQFESNWTKSKSNVVGAEVKIKIKNENRPGAPVGDLLVSITYSPGVVVADAVPTISADWEYVGKVGGSYSFRYLLVLDASKSTVPHLVVNIATTKVAGATVTAVASASNSLSATDTTTIHG